MCGIGGILYSRDRPELLQQKITRLGDSQQHRGPDGRSDKIWNRHGLCHQRLALLDAGGGTQPFSDATGRYTIVYNGEVYNYAVLKTVLQPYYTFSTACDTEVVLAAYIIWGEDCLAQFNGMFSFLIWDEQTNTAFAARDAVGVKPFVYYQEQETFSFASEVKALLSICNTHPALNVYAVAEYIIAPYLSGDGIPIHQSFQYLQPGHLLRINENEVTTHRWYQFNWQQHQHTHAQLATATAAAMEQSVRESIQADTPVGIFLSGGLDSSFIAAIAAKHRQQAMPAYTICFEQHQEIHFDPKTIVNSNDLPYAEQLAAILGLPLERVEAKHANLAASLQLLATINDRVPVWEQEFSQHFLSRAAANQVKAVLVGDAADETNYGYFFLLQENVNRSPMGLLHLFGAGQRLQLLAPRLQQQLEPLAYFEEQYRRLASAAGYDFNTGGEESILAMSTLVHQRWLTRLLHNGDIHTMHFGLEARVPFANRNMLDVVSQVYPDQGFENGMEKQVIRQAASRWLPPDFYTRKKSALPRDPRLGKHYQQLLYSLLEEKNEFIDTWLNRHALEALCMQPVVHENDRMQLFNMIAFIYWAKLYAK